MFNHVFRGGRIMEKFLVVLAGMALLSSPRVVAQTGHSPIQGVWQAVEVTLTGPGARIIAIPEPRPNLTIITAKYYCRLELQNEQPRPVLADASKATADELRATWGPFMGEAGTYEIAGNVITMRPIAAKNPAAMANGAFTTYTFKQEGNTMWVTNQKTQNGPIANPATIKVVRVE
jgi:hypothetical protein